MDASVNLLRTILPEWGVTLALQIVGVAIIALFAPVALILLTWLERKVVARVQDRLGPNRVGPYGLLQGVADAIKIITKEDIAPEGADHWVYNLAPMLSLFAALLIYAVIPIAPNLIGTDLNIGVVYLIAVGAVETLAVLMAGWSSNNKYALLGAFRAVAQLLSYEIPMVFALLAVVLVAGSLSTVAIINAQSVWFAFTLPIAFVLFLICSIAEVGRTPFDLTEAESELVAGYHVEYSGMKFALFYFAEYVHLFGAGAIATTIFLGGWRGPFSDTFPLLAIGYFLAKTLVIVFVLMWIRGTLPRIRIDQLLDFGWKCCVPLSVALVVVTGIVVKVVDGFFAQSLVLFAANVALGVIALPWFARMLAPRVDWQLGSVRQ